MARSGRFTIVLAILVLSWSTWTPCPAQAPATPGAAPTLVLTDVVPPAPSPPATPPQDRPAVLPPPGPTPGQPTPPPPLSPPNPLPAIDGKATTLKPPPLESADCPLPINLATALRLADARPLVVAIAQARAWVAEARLQRAEVYWVPALMMNAAYLRHDGPIDFNHGANVPAFTNALGQYDPASFGRPMNQNFHWFYAGLSLYQVCATTDAIFLPLAVRQELNAARWDI